MKNVTNKLKIYPTKELFESSIQRDSNDRLVPESFYGEKMKVLHREYKGSLGTMLEEWDVIALFEHSLLRSLNLETMSKYLNTENGVQGFNKNLEIIKEYYQRYPEQIQQSSYLKELLSHPKYILNLERGKYTPL